MPMTRHYDQIEAHNQYSFWSYCIVLVSTFALADVLSGFFKNESTTFSINEFVVSAFFMIATLGGYTLEAPPGARFNRFYSFHKL